MNKWIRIHIIWEYWIILIFMILSRLKQIGDENIGKFQKTIQMVSR